MHAAADKSYLRQLVLNSDYYLKIGNRWRPLGISLENGMSTNLDNSVSFCFSLSFSSISISSEMRLVQLIWRVSSQNELNPFWSTLDICWNINKIIRKFVILLVITFFLYFSILLRNQSMLQSLQVNIVITYTNYVTITIFTDYWNDQELLVITSDIYLYV